MALVPFGAGSPATAPPAGASPSTGDPNPMVDGGPFGVCYLEGFLIPGTIEELQGFVREHDYSVQKATSSNGATVVWKGVKVAENASITIAAPRKADFDGLYALKRFMDPKPGTKPPRFKIRMPQINFVGITSVSLRSIAAPQQDKRSGKWTIVIGMIENNPSKKTNVGAPAAANSGPVNPLQAKVEDAKDRLAKELAAP